MFLVYIWMFPSFSIIIINNLTIIIFMHITFSIFWILSSERFPEMTLLSQRAQILLWLLKDIPKMFSKRALPIYNEFNDSYLLDFWSALTIHVNFDIEAVSFTHLVRIIVISIVK